jgi:hypothetical protein
MSEGIEQKKALQPINCLEADTREPTLLAAEFRKVSSQLGELRRRETHLLRRIAFLEAERKRADDLVMQFQASTSWRVTQPLRWLAKKLGIRRPMT